jgi:CheY-like chemotaxis protein
MSRYYDFSALTALVVDDSGATRRIVNMILQAMGVGTVYAVGDAAAGFEIMEAAKLDVVITDWVMQPLDGGEFVRSIRNMNDAVRFVPIIVLTGHASARLVGKVRDAGADYTLAKPISPANVYRAFQHMREGDRRFVQVGAYFGPDRRRKARPFEFADRRAAGKAALDAPGAGRGARAVAG